MSCLVPTSLSSSSSAASDHLIMVLLEEVSASSINIQCVFAQPRDLQVTVVECLHSGEAMVKGKQ